MFLINPSDIEREVRKEGLSQEDIRIPGSVILTFNRSILDELNTLCNLKEWNWKVAGFSPYSAYSAKYWKGKLNDSDLLVIIPPMGASPLISLCEELVYFGAKRIFLLCASWSLGSKYLDRGEIHLPDFATGRDGTSIHYGNTDGKVMAEPSLFNALREELEKSAYKWKTGGVASCEALYRIDDSMVRDFIERGCISMENGEVASLYSFASEKSIGAGVLLQPYINLDTGWDISYPADIYRETCKAQANIAVNALRNLYIF